MLLADDLNQLLNVLPKFVSEPIEKHPNREQLIEIVLDLCFIVFLCGIPQNMNNILCFYEKLAWMLHTLHIIQEALLHLRPNLLVLCDFGNIKSSPMAA